MSLPISTKIESPILHELLSVGGSDDVRFLYQRLIQYFPTLSDAEIFSIKIGEEIHWKKAVQKAGKLLDANGFITRERGFWSITEKGRRIVETENSGIIVNTITQTSLSHLEIQNLLLEIGLILGFYSQMEFEYFDVIWREKENSPRISHVFEVQSKGNIDSAFAKLKRAYDAQRSKPFLVLSNERDSNRAEKSINQEFRELQEIITIVSFVEVKKIYENLNSISTILPKFLKT